MRYFTLICAVSAAPAFSACPDPVDYTQDLALLFEQARAAANDQAGREVSNQMWEIWLRAPDEAAQAVLDAGLRKRDVYDFAGARQEFDRLVAYCPTYAEGYNQRAFISFLREDYPAALMDLDRTLAISPNHVGAQSGRALTLMKMGRLAEARQQLLAALENNPWLSERFLLADGGPLAVQGDDI